MNTNEEQSQNTNTDENNEQEKKDNLIADSGQVLGKYSDEEYEKVLQDATNEVNNWLDTAEEKLSNNELKSQANELKEKIKALFLKDEDLKTLNEKIDALIEKVNEKLNEEREKKDEIQQENYEKIKDKVEEVIKKSYENEDFKEARTSLIDLQNELKEIDLKKSIRNEYQERINDAFQDVIRRQSEERENYEMECIENYHNLKGKVDEAVDFAKNTNEFGQARQKFINIQNDIKGKSLKRDQREELYQTIRDNFEALNERQEKDREQYLSQCKDNYDKLRIVVDEAIEFSKTTENYSDARQRLINAQSEIKGVKLTRDQRDKLYGDIREIFTHLNEQQSGEREEFEKESNENYEKLTKKVNDAFELVHGVTDFRLIREVLIAVQGEVKILKLKRDQRNELFGRIREAFSIFDKKKDEFFSKRRAEKADKMKNIKDNLQDKLSKMESTIEADRTAVENAQKELDEASEETKAEIQVKLDSLKSKLDNKEKEIIEAKDRIEDISKELSEIDKKD